MVNSNRGCITYQLRDIFAYIGWKSSFSPTVFWLYPLAEKHNPHIAKKYISGLQFSVAENTFIRLAVVALQSTKSREILR